MTGDTGKPRNLVHASFLALLAVCQLALAYDCTPAVIWCPHELTDYDASSYRTAPLSPLQKMNSDEFEKCLSQFNITEVIVFDDLCVEDLRTSKVLSNITNGSKIFYFPSVVAPNEVFRNYKQMRTINEINNDDHELNMVLKDIDLNACTAVTGKRCRFSHTERIKREVVAENSTELKIKTDKVLFYSAKPLLFKVPDKSETSLVQAKFSGASTHKDKDPNTEVLTMRFADVEDIGSVTIELSFVVKYVGYYTLNKVTYETSEGKNTLSTKRDITFPVGFSYHCSPKTVFSNGTTYLIITDMQLQVDHKNGTFSDAYDCVGFTSIPIWTGIFVTVILGVIMIWALTMIMDIRTMDRFDDPKGKTITISSAE